MGDNDDDDVERKGKVFPLDRSRIRKSGGGDPFPIIKLPPHCNADAQMPVGAWGGAIVGWTTGWFHPARIPEPKIPLPPTAPASAHATARAIIIGSALSYRIFKRIFVGSLVYPVVLCNLQGDRLKPSLLNCAAAGFICGGTFGLRGGRPGAAMGAMTFSVFAVLTEALGRIISR